MARHPSSAFTVRQYMLAKDFELYYYNDVNLRSVEMHQHDYVECYFFLEGKVEMQLNRQKCQPVPGDVLIVLPGTPHCLRVLDETVPYRRFVFWVSIEYLALLSKSNPECAYLFSYVERTGAPLIHFPVVPFLQLSDSLFALLDEIHADRYGKEMALSIRLNDVLLSLNRCSYELLEKDVAMPASSHYDAISRYILNHLSEELSLDQLSQTFYLSKYYIIHLFQDLIGLSPHQYITKQRLNRCADAIRSGTSISEAYLSCGFHDYSGFYRAFVKEYGESPRSYQKSHLPKEYPSQRKDAES
ncbi:MAG: helix-turn-helix domain-containing protein [Clostridia bacterium]|nr:helix-turn-helix domain-containing protein [Clostridia bacterium]